MCDDIRDISTDRVSRKNSARDYVDLFLQFGINHLYQERGDEGCIEIYGLYRNNNNNNFSFLERITIYHSIFVY